MRRSSGAAASGRAVDMSAWVGGTELVSPVMTAAGTSGYGAELSSYFDLSLLGAVVVKSLSARPWSGNPAPRVVEADVGMINSVGLDNPGTAAWETGHRPGLVAAGARVVVSIWGRTVAEFASAVPAGGGGEVVAVEVNLSCPNLGAAHRVFAHDAQAAGAVVEAVRAVTERPIWAKLSPNTDALVDVAGACLEAGADALTLVNTLAAASVDPGRGLSRLGSMSGGLSGPALRPVAVRAVRQCRQAFPGAALVGVGGVSRGEHAAELMVAGADAVQVGTATFVDPRAPLRVARELATWCERQGIGRVVELIGSVR